MEYPRGKYAIVEFLGREVLIGRISEVFLLSMAMLKVEPFFRDELMPGSIHPPRSIFRITVCEPEIAHEHQAATLPFLPLAIQLVMPRGVYDQAAADRAEVVRRQQELRNPPPEMTHREDLQEQVALKGALAGEMVF